MGSNFITLSGVARTPFAGELVTVSTVSIRFTAANVNGCQMMRARLEGGPIRFRFMAAPTATVGTYLQPGDIWECSRQELDAIMATGGLIRDTSAGADAKLWCEYYR